MSKHKKASPKNPKKVFDPNSAKKDPYANEAEEYSEFLGHHHCRGEVTKDKSGNY